VVKPEGEGRMSKKLLYTMFGIRGYDYDGMDVIDGTAVFRISPAVDNLRCGTCGSPRVIRRGTVLRTLRSLPIGSRLTAVQVPVQRVWCAHCQAVRQVRLQFADAFKSYTRPFMRYVLDLLEFGTIHDIARHLDVSWDTIKEIQKANLQRRFGKVDLSAVRQIAIDEIYVGKSHYLTVVLDLESGAVVHVADGKSGHSLTPFWQRLRRGGRTGQIEAVAMDMSAAFARSVRENLPGAVIVFDHFHLIKLYNEKLTALRRELQREATDKLQKAAIHGTRWLLLKNPENLSEEKLKNGKDERQRLQELLSINQPLATAYVLKESLRQLWDQPDKEAASAWLRQWVGQAQASGISMLQKFAKFLQVHQNGILAYYDYPISTGPLEGTNNKIKTMQREAYGYRDHAFFKLKILALHNSKLKLVG
jgi:transposase